MTFSSTLLERLSKAKVVAGFTTENPEDAVGIAKALQDGGVEAIEFTLRNDNALRAFERICNKVPDLIKGVGTILTTDQLMSVREAGADFGVAPGLDLDIVQQAKALRFSYAPGVMTPSELNQAIKYNCNFVKLFPAEASGGVKYLRSISAPFKHLNVSYFPFGGITEDNMKDYLNEDNVPAVGGSFLVPSLYLKFRSWSAIKEVGERICKQL